MSDIIRFSSTMIKFSPIRKKEDVINVMQLKIIEDTSLHSFINQFKKQIDFNDCFGESAVHDAWDKINIPVINYNINYKVTFSDVEFEAKLLNIAASRKETKDGTPYTEFVVTLEKELEKELDTQISYYIKRKEEDPDTGKKTIALYNTAFERV